MKKIIRFSPLTAILAVLVICGVVGAAVILTSNTVSVNQTVKPDANQIYVYNLAAPGDIFAGQTATYTANVNTNAALSSEIVYVDVARADGPNIAPGDVQFVSLSSTAPVAFTTTTTSWAGMASSSVYEFQITLGALPQTTGMDLSLVLLYNTAATYSVSLSMTGTI